MKKPVKIIDDVYAYVGVLPKGCQLCIQGVKLVVFITGLCDESCFYCPVSRQKLGRDVVYADEEPVKSIEDVLEEAERIGAEGASITGGDPLVRLHRTLAIIKLLKEYGGEEFHIHLYTSGRHATASVIEELERAGLDEIRFHPVERWMVKRVEEALSVRRRMSVGVEIPVLPDRVEETKKLLKMLDEIGVDFINLNELEASPDNIEALRLRGYQVKGVVAIGSYEAGVELVKWAAENLKTTVHFCPARYKDHVQMRIRLVRKALRTSYCFEEPTPRGTLRTVAARAVDGMKQCCSHSVRDYILLHPRCGVRGQVVEYYPWSDRLLRIRVG